MTWYESLAAFDVETTGVDVRSARIVSACLVMVDASGSVISRRDWLIDPGVPIPPQVSAIHGITDERARSEGMPAAQAIADIAGSIRGIFDAGIGLTVYNAPFDLSLLTAEAGRYGVPWSTRMAPVVDPIIIDKQVDRYRRGKRTLSLTAAHYGVTLDEAHNAGADAIAAALVAQRIGAMYAEKLPDTVGELHEAQIGWAAEQRADFERYMREKLGRAFVSDRTPWPGG